MKDQVVLEKNENYYDKDSVKLDKLTLKLVSEETSAWASYKSGQFDVVETVPKSDVQAALKDGTAKSFSNLATYFLSINVSDKAKAVDPNVAKVLSYPMTFLDMFQSTSAQDNCGYNNPKYDKLIDDAKKELDSAKRFDLMHQAEDMLMEDMPVVPLYYYTRTIGIKDYVKGARVSVMNTIYFKNANVEGKSNL